MQEFSYILILLASTVLMISICRRLHLPPIVGYLLVGVIVGPGGLRWIPSIEDMHFLAEFGVVFLMFTLGLEFSIPRVIAAKKYLLGLGGTQVVLCTIVAYVAGVWFGLEHAQAFVIGAALALSSTAVVIKQLHEQKEKNTIHGTLAIKILLFQDIAAVLLLIIVPAISSKTSESLFLTFFLTFLKGIGAVVILALIGTWVLKPLFHEVARARSTELFMLATLLVALSAAGITHYLDLSMALGAFLAGMMLGETEFRHQIELDIRPFRDVLLGLFFIVIGAYLELSQLPNNWLYVLMILLAIIILKTIIIMFITMLFGTKDKEAAFRTGFILAHGGEFGFVILTVAIQNDLISPSQKSAIFTALVFSILLAPLMVRFNKFISNNIFFRGKEKREEFLSSSQISKHTAEVQDHVILCGFGRLGQIIAKFLNQENIPWVALDMDSMRVSKASSAGEASFYGDAMNPATLAAAGLARARMVVISFSDEASALEVLKHVREMRLDLPVFVRTTDDTNIEAFQKAGATEVVPEKLEGSLMLASHLLLTLGTSPAKILQKIREVHSDRYDLLRGIYRGEDDINVLESDEARRSLHSIQITDDATVINRSLNHILPEKSSETEGPSIKKVIRGEEKIIDPELDMTIQSNDVIVVFATPEECYLIEEKIYSKN